MSIKITFVEGSKHFIFNGALYSHNKNDVLNFHTLWYNHLKLLKTNQEHTYMTIADRVFNTGWPKIKGKYFIFIGKNQTKIQYKHVSINASLRNYGPHEISN